MKVNFSKEIVRTENHFEFIDAVILNGFSLNHVIVIKISISTICKNNLNKHASCSHSTIANLKWKKTVKKGKEKEPNT